MLPAPRPGGRSSHLQPVRNTYSIASIVFLLSIRGRPPLGLGFSGSSNGSMRSQSASEIRCDPFMSAPFISRPPPSGCYQWVLLTRSASGYPLKQVWCQNVENALTLVRALIYLLNCIAIIWNRVSPCETSNLSVRSQVFYICRCWEVCLYLIHHRMYPFETPVRGPITLWIKGTLGKRFLLRLLDAQAFHETQEIGTPYLQHSCCLAAIAITFL